jgi:uncharacterized protein (DUF1778 family)
MNQTVNETGRGRVNLSVSPALLEALEGAAEALGMSVSQVTLSAVVAGLPALVEQVESCRKLATIKKQLLQIHKEATAKPRPVRK